MFEIPQTQFGRLAPLYGPDPPHANLIDSVLAGRTPARAYVDDAGVPTHCLLVANFLNFTFLGRSPDAAPRTA